LEVLSSDEFGFLRQLVSAAVATALDPVEIVRWTGSGGEPQLRLSGPDKKSGPIFETVRPVEAERLLSLLRTNGLSLERSLDGVDLALEGRTRFDRETLLSLEEVVGKTEAELFPGS
jgi:hypothetical protein